MTRALLVIVIAGCAADVPATPSFQQDVAPILRANCARCHLTPPIGGAPSNILYYSDEATPGPMGLAATIASRVTAREMPPRLQLADDQIEIIERWAEQGGERGAPRPGNRVPRLVAFELIGTEAMFELRDPDGDLFGGFLNDNTSAGPLIIGGDVQQGRNYITLEAGRTYVLTASVDDGGGIENIDIGTVTP